MSSPFRIKRVAGSPFRRIPFVSLGEPDPFPATFCPQFVNGSAPPVSPILALVSRVLRLSVCLRVWPGGPGARARGRHQRPFLPVSTGNQELVNGWRNMSDPRPDNSNPRTSGFALPLRMDLPVIVAGRIASRSLTTESGMPSLSSTIAPIFPSRFPSSLAVNGRGITGNWLVDGVAGDRSSEGSRLND